MVIFSLFISDSMVKKEQRKKSIHYVIPILFYGVSQVFINTVNRFYKVNDDLFDSGDSSEEVRKAIQFIKDNSVILSGINSSLLLLMGISMVRLIYLQKLTILIPSTFFIFVYALAFFYSNSQDFDYSPYFLPLCVEDKPTDYSGMIIYFSNMAIHILLLPFMLIYRFRILAAFNGA